MADIRGLNTVMSTKRPISAYALTSSSSEQTLSLTWNDVVVSSPLLSTPTAFVNVTMEVVLPHHSALSSWSIGVTTQSNSQTAVGVWEVTVSIPVSMDSDSGGELFFPSGYGETYYNPQESTGGSVSGLYPSG